MPHVIVHFMPDQFSQQGVTFLKQFLPKPVAEALSSEKAFPKFHPHVPGVAVEPAEVAVGQHERHPTDVNVMPLEVVVDAGESKGRDPRAVGRIIHAALCKLLRSREPSDIGVWMRFTDATAFVCGD